MMTFARRVLLLLALAGAFSCSGYHYLVLTDPPPLASLCAPPSQARAQYVIVVSIDGLRPDAIETADAKNLKKLMERGAVCPKAQTIRPSITLPSHTSMLTGLDFTRHGVVWNNYRSGYIVHPTVFSVAAQVGKKSAMLFSKDKFHFLAHPSAVSWIYGPPAPNRIPVAEDYTDAEYLKLMLKKEEEGASRHMTAPPVVPPGDLMTTDEMLARAFARVWPTQKWPLTFVHFREADEAGHRKGWMGPEYIAAVKSIDAAMGDLVATIDKNGGFEKTALIVTADHGGSGRGHYRWTDPDKTENVSIPWICVAPGVPAGLKIDRIVRTYDTAPTALAFMGIGAPEGIDGHAVEEVLR
jgi:predicted AlkP superfamily pyrophosphatase or phosphodiesterase